MIPVHKFLPGHGFGGLALPPYGFTPGPFNPGVLSLITQLLPIPRRLDVVDDNVDKRGLMGNGKPRAIIQHQAQYANEEIVIGDFLQTHPIIPTR
jgi:hypothetical protein